MTSLAVMISTAILRAWGSGLVGEDVVAFVVSETGASVDAVNEVLAEMRANMMD